MNQQPMRIEQILSALEYNTGAFPREAVKAAVARREEIVPELLQILEDAIQDPLRLIEEDGYIAHLYAFYLLAQFREPRAYPLVIKFFSMPDEVLEFATSEFITESLGQVLASVCHGDLAPIKRLIEDETVNEWVRGAAIQALVALVANDEKPRDEVIAYFQSLFHGGLERELSSIWANMLVCSLDLHAEELREDIKQAFADGLIDTWFARLDDALADLNRNKERVLTALRHDRDYALIENTVEEMEWWACFESPPAPSESQPRVRPAPPPTKVGRNDPCPCGSGRKYKHCCGKPGKR